MCMSLAALLIELSCNDDLSVLATWKWLVGCREALCQILQIPALRVLLWEPVPFSLCLEELIMGVFQGVCPQKGSWAIWIHYLLQLQYMMPCKADQPLWHGVRSFILYDFNSSLHVSGNIKGTHDNELHNIQGMITMTACSNEKFYHYFLMLILLKLLTGIELICSLEVSFWYKQVASLITQPDLGL